MTAARRNTLCTKISNLVPGMIGGSEAALAPAAEAVRGRRERRHVTLAESAWIAAGPCALALIAAMLVLGPPLGRWLLGPAPDVFFPEFPLSPEPTEHANYVLALLGPALVAAATLLLARREIRLDDGVVRWLVRTSQLLLIAFLVLCLAAENDIVVHTYPPPQQPNRFFNLQTLLLAVAVPAGLLLLLRSGRVARRIADRGRETTLRRHACMLAAAAFAALWLVTCVETDRTVGNSLAAAMVEWPLNEALAILNGRTPLVEFYAPYGQLSGYLPALTMSLFGATVGVFTVTMASVSWLAIVSVYATFRRIVRNSLLALALYVPFVAVTYFIGAGTRAHRISPANIFSHWPIRYAGPYLVAWLVCRHLDALRPRRAWLLFLAGGLVALNNAEFGAGAVLGTLLALACQPSVRSRRAAARLLASAAGGLGAALGLFVLFAVVRAGRLPDPRIALEYPRLFGKDGWHLAPMHMFGFHMAAYVTFAAAIVVAAVRARQRAEDVVLTGMLAWSGGFGLLAGSYYVGESEPGSMLTLFSAWFFALALLVVVVARSLAAREWRRPTAVELLVLFGFALSLDAVLIVPFPWSEVARLRQPAPTAIYQPPRSEQTVREQTQRGERVMILTSLSFRIAYDLGLRNVSPFLSIEEIPTRQMMQRTIDAARAHDVHKIFVDERVTTEQVRMLEAAGFRDRGDGLLSDTS